MWQLNASVKESVRNAIREKVVDSSEYDTWFKDLDFHAEPEGSIRIPLQNPYFVQAYERRYRPLLEDALAQILGQRPVVRFSSEGFVAAPRQEIEGVVPEQPPACAAPSDSPVNSLYTFRNFVVGRSNRMAYHMAQSVAQQPGRAHCNPLFVYGSVGLGKTHLLHGIYHELRKNFPHLAVCYTSCEAFVNSYIGALYKDNASPFRTQSSVEDFRLRFRSVGVLLIDDIHFLANKQSSQEEIFHTYNYLHDNAKQVVLSSDSPAIDIPTLRENLISRFRWGVSAGLDAPDFETRLEILRGKAELRGWVIPPDVLHYIAETVQTNIRELESAITKVASWAEFNERPIDLALARDALRDFFQPRPRLLRFEQIRDAVCYVFQVSPQEIASRRRTAGTSVARQVAMFLVKRLMKRSHEEIGGLFGGKDHSTVVYAVQRVEARLAEDREFSKRVEDACARLGVRL